eukprot:451881-Amphidinium_carterae.1
MSDPGLSYAYSGRDNVGVEWHAAVLEIKAKAEKAVAECGLGHHVTMLHSSCHRSEVHVTILLSPHRRHH